MNSALDHNLLQRHARDFRRQLANRKFELHGNDLILTEPKLKIGGAFLVSLNGEPLERCPNKLTFEALDDLLNVYLHGGAQTATWYLALFSGNVTVDQNWTGANFDTNATEFTGYDEANRPAWVEAAASGQSISNVASPAVFTFNTAATVYGAALLSNPVKESTTGKLCAIARFGTAKTPDVGDLLNVVYEISAVST